uniref:Uncharacterized protein n=1 Tax=Timema cristinae TaxID=61476 RepID=A0A7R9HAV7_TIMCR|nr:unnamed protein product [Timema cristinae]
MFETELLGFEIEREKGYLETVETACPEAPLSSACLAGNRLETLEKAVEEALPGPGCPRWRATRPLEQRWQEAAATLNTVGAQRQPDRRPWPSRGYPPTSSFPYSGLFPLPVAPLLARRRSTRTHPNN